MPFFSCPQSFPASGSFPVESALHVRWPKYWSFSFSISPSDEYSGLISFRISWFDPLAVQGTQESSLAPQLESISSSVLSLLYGPVLTSIHDCGKIIPLIIWIFVSKVMSLLFNTLSGFVIAFLLLKEQASFNFVAAVTVHSDFGAQENKICHCFPLFPLLFVMKQWDQMPVLSAA